NVYKATYYDQILKDLGEDLNLRLDRRFLKAGDIRQLIANTKKRP
ncbi:MAG TPA: hypothetical protein GXZ66_10940, partial [Clostridiaceae bacterium]|nr:hypothetical protein [Clostridiaceae bacterium]